jgi:membrane-associated phospholipid phosphatase
LLVGIAAEAQAQAPVRNADPYRFIEWTGQDVTAFVKAVPTRQSLYVAAGMGGVVLLLARQDDDVTQGAADLAAGTYRPVRTVANEIGNVNVVQPMALMLFLGSMLSDQTRFQDAAFTSLEAILFANLITDTLKGVVGRARPFQEEGATMFRPFSGNTSFPSGHATTVFAFTTPWLVYYQNYRVLGLFLLGAGTAFTRMADEAHWFSDVIVGAAIGMTTGYLLSKRHQRQAPRVTIHPVVAARQAGITVRIRP